MPKKPPSMKKAVSAKGLGTAKKAPAPKKRAAAKTAVSVKKAVARTSARPEAAAPQSAATPPVMAPIAPVTAPSSAATAAVLDRLFTVIMDRRTADPARSHSARLLSRGAGKVAQKFGEEAVECLIEAVTGNTEALVSESADVLYHLVVMWVAAGVMPEQVWAELTRREGVSGVDEKASRIKPLFGTAKIP